MQDRTQFTPLDPAGLPHYPRHAAVNAPALRDATALIGRAGAYHLTDDGSRRLMDALTLDDAVDTVVDRLAPIGVDVTAEDVAITHRGRIPRQLGRYLAAVLGILALTATVLGLTPGTGTAAQAATASKGPGLTLKVGGRSYFVGPYVIGGRLLFCTDEGLLLGDGRVAQGRGVAKVDDETRARLDLLVNTYGQVTDARSAARVKLAVATLVAPADPAMRKVLPSLLAQMTAADRTAITGMVDASRTHAPYRVTVDLAGAVPGQVGTVEATVTGSDGRPAVGRQVTWTLSGGTLTTTAKTTDTQGRARAEFASSGLGQQVTATVVSPSSTAVWQNTPTRGHQLMIGGGFTDATKGSATAELCPVEATHRTVCPCKKVGDREITVTWTAADLTGAYRGTVTVDGTEVAHADLAAGETGEATIHVQPGQTITVGYSIYASARTGAPLFSDVLDSWTQR